jgi:choline kinase
MKAVILSAGQGRRLLPLTTSTPKCALSIHGRSLLEWQLSELIRCGIDRITVVVGFGADRVEQIVAGRRGQRPIRTLFNPFFAVADNLASCWVARTEMIGDFLLLNGDTMFEAAVVQRLLGTAPRPVTVATDHKAAYDADDMKVSLAGDKLLRVGKDLPPEQVDGESIGMLLFRGEGPALFRAAVEQALRDSRALDQWYLSVIDEMARAGLAWTVSMQGLQWIEIDSAADLDEAVKLAVRWVYDRGELAGTSPV